MRSVFQALFVKTILWQSLMIVSACADQDSITSDCFVMKHFQRYDESKLFENSRGQLRDEQSSSHPLEHGMKSNEPFIHRDLTSLISVLQNKIFTETFRITSSMWSKVLLLVAVRVICKSTIASELQLLSLVFVHIESSMATPSPVLTSSSHMVQSTIGVSGVGTVTSESKKQYYHRGDCDLGWYEFGLYCYMPADELKTFDHAQRACIYHDANLVSISSQEENAIAFNMSKHFFGLPEYMWIGMERRSATKRLHWIDGVDLNYNNWIIGEPDSNGACVQMLNDGLWEDINCYQKLPFICKKRSSYPPPYTRLTELGIMIGIPFTFVLVVLTFVGVLLFRSIKDADDTFYGYGKNRNREKMHSAHALINLSASIAHVSTTPPECRQVTPRKASKTNSRSQSVSSSHVNPAIEISDFGSQSSETGTLTRPQETGAQTRSQETERISTRPKQTGTKTSIRTRPQETGPLIRSQDTTERIQTRPKQTGTKTSIRTRPQETGPLIRSQGAGAQNRSLETGRLPTRPKQIGTMTLIRTRPLETGHLTRSQETERLPTWPKQTGTKTSIRARPLETGNDRINNNRIKSDPEEIEMQECVSSISIDKDHPLESATSLDHLVNLKPKSRRLKGLRKPETTVRPPGKEGMYRLKTYV